MSKNPNTRCRDCARQVVQTSWERRRPRGRTRRMRLAPRALSLIVLAFAMATCVGAENRAATAVAAVTNGSLAGIIVTDGGSGYVTPPSVTLVGGGGTGGSAASQVSDGAVTNII